MSVHDEGARSPAGSAFRGIARQFGSAVFFMVLTGIAYPLLTTAAAQLLFPDQARGSLIERDGKVIGSRLIGQHFSQPQYFHGRPSLTGDHPYNGGASGASNQGVLSSKLLASVAERSQAYRAANGLAADAPVPVDAVTASGSGLDPHISPANARLQASRVAQARKLPQQEVLQLVEQSTLGRQVGILGEPRVNVLKLNLALDRAAGSSPTAQ